MRTGSTEINKNLVTDLVKSLSFEYVEAGAEVIGKAMAEDTLAKIVADKFNIYLKNPTCIQHMEYDELIYVYEEEQYKFYFETLPELEKDYDGLRHRIFGAMCRGEIDGFRPVGKIPAFDSEE